MIRKSNLEFRKIPSLLFLYEVREDGRVFRNVKSKKNLKIKLDIHHSKSGYYVTFVNIKGKVKRVMIHSIVAECWLGSRPNNLEIDHIDRNTHNNHFTNLRYVSHSEQMKNRVLSERLINIAKENCYKWCMKNIAKAVRIKKDNSEWLYFQSMTQASYYLAKQLNKTSESVRARMKQRRKFILGYNIEYLKS